MNVQTFEIGRVVLSTQGRDKGRLFIVVDSINEAFVSIADGDLRKLNKPKRKKIKHLKASPYLANHFLQQKEQKQHILDSSLRTELDTFREVCNYGKR
ncbi:MAG: KOW domain-containing RNA-binding protein [Eubacteriales bacterium]|nr:KOW domain-containing RNA-binding protein [Eubacteriales bacterium]